jgi:hypothetical protein
MKLILVIFRTLLVGFNWSVIMAFGLWHFMFDQWRIDIINQDHWRYLWDGWMQGASIEYGLFATLVGGFFIWIMGWRQLLKPNYRKFAVRLVRGCLPAKKPPEKDTEKNTSQDSHDPDKYVPVAATTDDTPYLSIEEAEQLRVQTTGILPDYAKPNQTTRPHPQPANAPAQATPTQESAAAPPQQASTTIPDPANTISDDEDGEDGVVYVARKLKDLGYTCIPSVTMQEYRFDLVAIGKERILLVNIDAVRQDDWLADETVFDDSPPSWFSETDYRPSPVWLTSQAHEEFIDTISDNALDIQPILVVALGEVINATEMEDSWVDMGVTVVRTGDGGPEELPELEVGLAHNDEGAPPEDILAEIRAMYKPAPPEESAA